MENFVIVLKNEIFFDEDRLSEYLSDTGHYDLLATEAFREGYDDVPTYLHDGLEFMEYDDVVVIYQCKESDHLANDGLFLEA